MVRTRRLAVTALYAVLVWSLGAAAAVAYVGQNPYTVRLEGPDGPVRCDSSAEISAIIRSSESGQLIEGQSISWDFAQSRTTADAVSPSRTVTDAGGRATVTVRFGPVEGQRTIRAIIIPQFPETIKVTCQGGVVTPPPKTPSPTAEPSPTATAPPSPSTQPTPSRPVSSTASLAPASVTPTTAPESGSPTAPPESVSPSQVAPSPSPAILPVAPSATAQLDLLPIALVALIGIGMAGAAFVYVRRR